MELTDVGAACTTGRPARDGRPVEGVGGRGLGVVAALSARHGVRAVGCDVTPWADLPIA